MQTIAISLNLSTVGGIYLLLFGLILWFTCIVGTCFSSKSAIPSHLVDIGMGGVLCAFVGTLLLMAKIGILDGLAVSAVIVAPAGLLECARYFNGRSRRGERCS